MLIVDESKVFVPLISILISIDHRLKIQCEGYQKDTNDERGSHKACVQ
jgi:hypothetical protein